MSESKEKRQEALIQLLRENAFFSQKAICAEIEKLGFSAAQPSISRDFRELGIMKVAGRYLPPTSISEQIPNSLTLSVHTAGPNMIVVRTKVGAANAVAAQVDDLEVEGVVGTVAGDDTIFLAIDGAVPQESVVQSLQKRLI